MKIVEVWTGVKWSEIKTYALPIGTYTIRVREIKDEPRTETRQPNILRVIRRDGGDA